MLIPYENFIVYFQLEGSNEVKLWNDIFTWTQQRVQIKLF